MPVTVQAKLAFFLSDVMTKPNKFSKHLIFLCLFAIWGVSADEPGELEITSQGFSAEFPVEGVVRQYPRVRVRIEAPGRIRELIIKERSYEVDLASTRDKSNLSMFGLEQSPRSHADITLNLQNYINERIEGAGEYEFHILVADNSGNSVEKKIILNAKSPAPEENALTASAGRLLRNGEFMFQRTGTGPVEGARQFGLDWQNVDGTDVAIRISTLHGGASDIVLLDKADFDRLETMEQLAERVASLEKTDAIVLAIGSNRAAGQVFSVVSGERLHLFKIVSSSAYPSGQGTIVSVKGLFKTGQTIEDQ